MATALVLAREKDDVLVVSFNVTEVTDSVAIQQIEREIEALKPRAAAGRKLLLDFSGVEFISSMAIGLIVRLHSDCKRQGIRLRLSGLLPSVQAVFRITGLRKVLDIHANEGEAMDAFGMPPIGSDA
jgi:anti-sigma B factor antagonist